MAAESYILAVCNIQKTDSRADQERTIRAALRRADYIIFNEAGDKAHSILREVKAEGEWDVATFGAATQLPHAWRKSKFTSALPGGWRRIMKGGRRVFGRSNRKRRLGPSRFGTRKRVRLVASGLRVRHIGTHLMARVFTAHPERKALYFASVKALNSWAWSTRNRGVPDVMAGDMNRNPRVPFGPRWKRVALKQDLGGNTYTHCYVRANGAAIKAVSAGEIAKVPTDHDIQLIRVTLGTP